MVPKITIQQIMMKRLFFLFTGGILLALQSPVQSQDTLRVSLSEFIERGLENSGQISYQQGEVQLARNTINRAKSQRFLPNIELNTQHGTVPGVVSDSTLPGGQPLPERQYYLDPNLSNDWEDWAIFTRAEISAVQPVFSWGAIKNAIRAAEAGAQAAQYQFEAAEAEAELQLFDLYYSYLLAREISIILEDAQDQLNQVENQLDEMLEEGNESLKESDIFKFEIFKSEFEVQRVEVEQSVQYVRRMWNYALSSDETVYYVPEDDFLEPVGFELEDFKTYEQWAMESRAELKGVDSGIDARKSGLDAVKSQQYPMVYLGLSGSYANTPNRPRQSNPFIRNSTNYASMAVGFGIRQNLNFLSMRSNVERARIEYKRVQDLKGAVQDGIIIELNDRYREAVIAESRYQQSEESLTTARNWVRHEQLNYDYGFGDVEDLVDALKQELELRVEVKQNAFDLNKKVAELFKAAGISVDQLSLN